jgi:hypothetical protein
MTSRTNEKFGHYAYLETGLVAPPFYRKDGIMYVNNDIFPTSYLAAALLLVIPAKGRKGSSSENWRGEKS